MTPSFDKPFPECVHHRDFPFHVSECIELSRLQKAFRQTAASREKVNERQFGCNFHFRHLIHGFMPVFLA
jgi:hypothetical protein